jgi:hypothetical protein
VSSWPTDSFASVKEIEMSKGMQYRLLPNLVLWLGLLASCQPGESATDPEKLKHVLTSYFEGIQEKDFNKMTEATTDDFILYEMGRVWNNDSVFQNINDNLPFTVTYKFDNFKIEVDNRSGHMSYYNTGIFVFNDTTRQRFNWIESAAFRKDKEGWKMSFLHITERYEAKK